MIPLIGTIQSYVKNLDQMRKAELKRTNLSIVSSQKSLFPQINNDNNVYRLDMIKKKLRMGTKLNISDMQYLRSNAPDLYVKAVALEKERDFYKKDLRKCKTKEEVRQLQILKSQSILVTNSDAVFDVDIRSMAMNDEHIRFTKSRAYQELPKNNEELLNRKKKELEVKVYQTDIVDVEKNNDVLDRMVYVKKRKNALNRLV